MNSIKQYITDIPDFPEKGIIFHDITSLIGDADGLKLALDEMISKLDGVEFDAIVGLESRGFLFGMPMAYILHKAFIPIRKKGKLPRETVGLSYDLEYGKATIEVHKQDIKPGMRLVLVDDLIATGGTLEAACRLLYSLDATIVQVVCLVELKGLNGRNRIKDCPVTAVVSYECK